MDRYTIQGCMLSMGQLKCGLEVKDAPALNIYSINRFIRVEARLLLIFSTSGNASSIETRPIPNVGAHHSRRNGQFIIMTQKKKNEKALKKGRTCKDDTSRRRISFHGQKDRTTKNGSFILYWFSTACSPSPALFTQTPSHT